ncbi:piercer of microtubule wall 1 protein isoform X2 [Amyelois transitella]|uniref:piercer of microtubule wall 1 protein isoform X2 n=1 Tax=Amyelois transitella TaxID=680683 RepID=UPI00298F4692|nr:piercer of microtubule wall 1 protein isoform X2 [Amyelois transitella]
MGDKGPEGPKEPGFCSATCVDRASLQNEIKKPDPKTSDLFVTCNLPKRFDHPHWFNGYGCQVSKQHPFYRTSASVYGWYPPGPHSVPTSYFPKNQGFTNAMAKSGMYRNYSLNTRMDPLPY